MRYPRNSPENAAASGRSRSPARRSWRRGIPPFERVGCSRRRPAEFRVSFPHVLVVVRGFGWIVERTSTDEVPGGGQREQFAAQKREDEGARAKHPSTLHPGGVMSARRQPVNAAFWRRGFGGLRPQAEIPTHLRQIRRPRGGGARHLPPRTLAKR